MFHRNVSASSEQVVDTPILATTFRRGSNGRLEYWVVFDEIEPTTEEEALKMRTQWSSIAIYYAVTVGKHDGRDPDRLVAVGLNDKFNNTHYTVPTSKALQAWRGEINSSQYTAVWWNRMSGHPDDDKISKIAMQMVRGPEGERTPVDSRDE